ncbi:Sorbitol dehydrogenase [Actinomadura rubteroloni]|uniref:Sorbitol dehydrogenase n=1 Tax=Actinomadura rubteroloni TaxID=1926885 RepID=A0A2P4UIA6_9ACTN|nr:SDR family oxidoreductase [Actinomadura rubteroloni]POM24792.1 Sorbitol dehydrogenase [Actinomadura rubteroloni]
MTLRDKKLLIIGSRSGIARRIAADATAAGAEVVLAGRGPDADARVDLADEDSIRALAERVGTLDHLVALGADRANGPVTELDRAAVTRAFDAKVIGPIMLAKHFAGRFRPGGSVLLFSGVAAWRPVPGRTVMAATNGAVAFLAEALAVELAPVRVNAISPGVIDSGVWDGLGDAKDAFFADTAARNPTGTVGRTEDVASAALLALANPFVTGTTLHVDGGGRLA